MLDVSFSHEHVADAFIISFQWFLISHKFAQSDELH